MIRFTVQTVPVAQPRQRHCIKTVAGRSFAHNYTPAAHPVNAFKVAVQVAARQAFQQQPLEGPLSMKAVFVLPRPKKYSGKKYSFRRLWCPAKPDTDNLCKSLKDALEGHLYRNDSQICVESIFKMYAGLDEQPCVEVTIGELTT